MRRLLISQFSDLHLGAGLAGGRLALPPSKVQQRRAEQRQGIERFAAHVREIRPDLVLLPGDLFDSGEPDADDLNFLINTVNGMGPTPVFIAPGNHDGYAPSSCYNAQSALYLSRGGGPKWGNHVRIFTSERFETLPIMPHGSVTVTGAAFRHHMPESQHVLADVRRPLQDGVHLLVFHGSLSSYPRAGADKEVLPFAAPDLQRAGFAYAAVGHYHHGGPILGPDGRILGAYAGAPFAASLSDAMLSATVGLSDRAVEDTAGQASRATEGVGTWLDVELKPGQPLTEDALHAYRCDPRSIHRIEMDVTGLTDSTALSHRLDAQLAARKAAPADLVHLTLRGRLVRGVQFRPEASLRERFFHAVVDAGAVDPDYDIQLDAEPGPEPDLAATSEDVFRWKMLELYREATTDEERERLRAALYYGLDALTLGEIHLR